jgi:hypothetical protein
MSVILGSHLRRHGHAWEAGTGMVHDPVIAVREEFIAKIKTCLQRLQYVCRLPATAARHLEDRVDADNTFRRICRPLYVVSRDLGSDSPR